MYLQSAPPRESRFDPHTAVCKGACGGCEALFGGESEAVHLRYLNQYSNVPSSRDGCYGVEAHRAPSSHTIILEFLVDAGTARYQPCRAPWKLLQDLLERQLRRSHHSIPAESKHKVSQTDWSAFTSPLIFGRLLVGAVGIERTDLNQKSCVLTALHTTCASQPLRFITVRSALR